MTEVYCGNMRCTVCVSVCVCKSADHAVYYYLISAYLDLHVYGQNLCECEIWEIGRCKMCKCVYENIFVCVNVV